MQAQGEKVRKAVRWISENRRDNPDTKINPLVHSAISRFDLNPKEAEELMQFYRNADKISE